MKKSSYKANYIEQEIESVSQIPKTGGGLVVFNKNWYDLDQIVRQYYGDKEAIVYFIRHKYDRSKTESICYYILIPLKDKHG